MNIRPEKLVADVVVERGVGSGAIVLLYPRARGRSPRACASSIFFRRNRSIARFLAVAISQAPGFSGTPGLGPAFERGDERILRQLFREPHVAHDPREAGDQLRLLDPPDRFDRAVRFGRRFMATGQTIFAPFGARPAEPRRG